MEPNSMSNLELVERLFVDLNIIIKEPSLKDAGHTSESLKAFIDKNRRVLVADFAEISWLTKDWLATSLNTLSKKVSEEFHDEDLSLEIQNIAQARFFPVSGAEEVELSSDPWSVIASKTDFKTALNIEEVSKEAKAGVGKYKSELLKHLIDNNLSPITLGFKEIEDAVDFYIAIKSPRVNFKDYPELEMRDLEVLFEHIDNLETLTLGTTNTILDLSSIDLPNTLKTLDLKIKPMIILPSKWPNSLENLFLGKQHYDLGNTITGNLSQLRHLEITGKDYTLVIAELPELKSLKMDGCFAVKNLPQVQKLEQLVYFCPNVKGLRQFPDMPELKWLYTNRADLVTPQIRETVKKNGGEIFISDKMPESLPPR